MGSDPIGLSYGMEVHNGAAMIIGRRSYEFKEKIPKILKDKLITDIDKINKKNEWARWSEVNRIIKRKVGEKPGIFMILETRRIMGWKFWENRKKSEKDQALVLLKEEVSQLTRRSNTVEDYLHKFENKLDGINQQLENNENVIQKLLRLEYKSSQEIIKKLNQVNDKIDETMDYSERFIEVEREKSNLIKEKNFILENNIQWLDDIDLIYDKIYGQDQEHWIQLLEGWQKQIIKSLEILRIYEIDIIGKTFNHEVAESVSTKKKEVNKDYLPYEVVDVLQRGFILEDGTLLKKAKVITIEEEMRKGDYEQ